MKRKKIVVIESVARAERKSLEVSFYP